VLPTAARFLNPLYLTQRMLSTIQQIPNCDSSR